jgi:hypothetical protein
VTKTFLSLAFLTLATCNIAQAQETPIGGVEMGQSEASATAAINAACDRVARIEVMATRLPELSRELGGRLSERRRHRDRAAGDTG